MLIIYYLTSSVLLSFVFVIFLGPGMFLRNVNSSLSMQVYLLTDGKHQLNETHLIDKNLLYLNFSSDSSHKHQQLHQVQVILGRKINPRMI